MENGKEPINPVDFNKNYSYNGLTKREYFAGLAMQGLISSNQHLSLSKEEAIVVASQSIQFADELLKQLEK